MPSTSPQAASAWPRGAFGRFVAGRPRAARRGLDGALAILGLAPLVLLFPPACDGLAPVGPLEPIPPITRQPTDAGALTAMHRLTQRQWRGAVQDLLNTSLPPELELPPDFVLHGYSAVGSAEVTVAPLDFEQYEAAAWAVAELAVPNAVARDALLGCSVEPPLGAEEGFPGADGCLRAFLTDFLSRAWRRPANLDAVDRWTAVFHDVHDETESETLAVQALVAGALASPDFLFRLAFGEEPPDIPDIPDLDGDGPSASAALEPALRRLDDHELAARLALVFTDHPPSTDLRTLADAGLLDANQPDPAADEAAALFADPAAAPATQAFFTEWMDLATLELATKDPILFPTWNDALRAAMAAETNHLVAALVAEDADLRTLFTSREGWLTPELALVYGVADPGDPGSPVELPPERAGLLSRGAFLSTWSHAALTSPTRRGKFVRTRLLCEDVPPPPPGVIASLDGTNNNGTLRDLLEGHADDPACASCHRAVDPIGFALENYDAIGRWRTLDNDLPVDASSQLDGVPVEGGPELGAAVADHPAFPNCVAANAWRHALGHLEQRFEQPELRALGDGFVDAGHRLSQLAVEIASTEAFRSVAVPEGGACSGDEEGSSRPCSTSCGDGVEVCAGGTWLGCTAVRPIDEACNGLDDDCDGLVDDGVIAACRVGGDGAPGGGLPGVMGCSDGTWGACSPAWLPETCNGVDDDGDGAVDEDLAVDIRPMGPGALTARHPGCQPSSGHWSPDCRAATHRECAATGCASTGLGPIAWDEAGNRLALSCLSPDEGVVVSTTYTVLATHHEGCNQTTRMGGACNAAINRFCGAQGMRTGYGPLENSGDTAIVGCNPGATTYETSYTALSALQSGCNASGGNRVGEDCDLAFHQLCRSLGHKTGHGPLENSGDVAGAACVGVLP